MIHVKRPETVPPSVLDALSKPFARKAGKNELELAREYYSENPPPKKAYAFSRYKAFEVCQALDDLFHEKCAYCESTYRAVDVREIEHFRPKGAVSQAPAHPGYWWLASDWSNLLPSCPACNQLRRHLAFDPGMTLDEFESARQNQPQLTSGKGNSFPLRENNWVVAENGDLTTEDPLLINPCERNPEKHLEWVFEWDHSVYLWEADRAVALVRPRAVNGLDDPYGKTSIATYGLNRTGLIRERMARINDLQLVCRPVVDAVLALQDVQTLPQLASLRERLRRYKEGALTFGQPAKTYAGMVRAFLAEFDRELTRLADPTL